MQATTVYNNKNALFSFISLNIALFSSIYFRFKSYTQTEFANGWDSYFYLIQLKSYIESGETHSSDLSLIYPLMLGIQYIVGNYIITFKLTACLLSIFLILSTFLVALKFTKKIETSLILPSFFCFSPHLTYFASQYPKNLLGFILFLLLILVIPSNKKTTRWNQIANYTIFAIILFLNYFGHRMTFVLSIGLLISIFIVQKTSPKFILLLMLAFLTLVGLGTLLPGLLSFSDFERFEGLLAPEPHFAPYSFWQSFGESRIAVAWKWEIIGSSIGFFLNVIYGLYSLRKPSKSETPARNSEIFGFSLTIICAFLIFPFFKWSLDGIAYRSFLIFMLVVPIAFFLNICAFISRQNFVSHRKLIQNSAGSLAVLFSFSSILSFTGYSPQKHDPPYSLYSKISERVINQMKGKELELLICHKSLAEYFTFTTGIDALPWLPEYEIDKGKLWRVASDVSEHKIQQYLSESNQQSIKKLSVGYHLIREDVWQKFLKELHRNGELETLHQLETWKNPDKMRPSYLLRGKK